MPDPHGHFLFLPTLLFLDSDFGPGNSVQWTFLYFSDRVREIRKIYFLLHTAFGLLLTILYMEMKSSEFISKCDKNMLVIRA